MKNSVAGTMKRALAAMRSLNSSLSATRSQMVRSGRTGGMALLGELSIIRQRAYPWLRSVLANGDGHGVGGDAAERDHNRDSVADRRGSRHLRVDLKQADSAGRQAGKGDN